jgi:hypothetical protein
MYLALLIHIIGVEIYVSTSENFERENENVDLVVDPLDGRRVGTAESGIISTAEIFGIETCGECGKHVG